MRETQRSSRLATPRRHGARAVVVALVTLLAALPFGIAGAQGTNANIPNAAVLPWGTDQTGKLDYHSETDDVYRFDLKKGALIVLTLSGDANTDFDLYLFAPGSVNIQDDHEVASSEHASTSNESIRYRATRTGTYYLDVATWTTSGSYTLKARVRPTLSISTSKGVFDYGTKKQIALSGIMDPPRAGVTVKIKSSPGGKSSFSSLGSAVVGADGKYRFVLKQPTESATYRADWNGDVAFLPTTSGETKVEVRPVILGWATTDKEIASTSSSNTAVARQVALSGQLKAGELLPNGEKVAIELMTGSKIKHTIATVSTTLGKGWFSYTFKSGTPGTYRIRAHFLGDRRWLSEASPERAVTVLP